MTLKYTLTIEGTEREIECVKGENFYIRREDTTRCYATYVAVTPEYKVVEPLRYEFTTTTDDLGDLDITRTRAEKLVYRLGPSAANKKLKVVITEEE